MVVNWPEIALIVALNGSMLLGLALWTRYRLLSKAEQWMGGAIGRFMQNLSAQAAEEEGGSSTSSPGSALNLGGFKIDPATIKSIAEILKVVQGMGFLKKGGSGGFNPP